MATKTLFDHIKAITEFPNINYWSTVSPTDKKTWSNYMVHRFLSMNSDWCEIVNEVQQYELKPKDLYLLYINVFPKGKRWLKYIKKQQSIKFESWIIELISIYYSIGLSEAAEYVEIYYTTEEGKMELKRIIQLYGKEEKLIKRAKL